MMGILVAVFAAVFVGVVVTQVAMTFPKVHPVVRPTLLTVWPTSELARSLLTVKGWKIRLVPPGSSAPIARTPPVTRGIRSPLGKLATALMACTWP